MSVETLGSSPGGGVAIQSGLLVNRPAFGVADRWYYATDVYVLFRDTGAAWEKVGGMLYARYLDTLFSQRNSTPAAIPIGIVYLVPVQVEETVVVDALVITVDVAAGNVRAGLYNDNGLLPDGGALVVESGAVATAVGKLECPIANTRLTPALYWLGTQNDNAALNLVGQGLNADQFGAAPTVRNYAQAFGAFTNPCPVTVLSAEEFLGKLRVLSIP